MITASRRTPPELFEAVLSTAQDIPRIVWSGAGDNPYPSFLAAADAFLVTADSVNMTGEAAATGRPIHVFRPSGAAEIRPVPRRARTLRRRASAAGSRRGPWRHGATSRSIRPPEIADEILERWRLRRCLRRPIGRDANRIEAMLKGGRAIDRADGFAAGGTRSAAAGRRPILPTSAGVCNCSAKSPSFSSLAPLLMRHAVFTYDVPLFYALPPVLIACMAFLFLDPTFHLKRELSRGISAATLKSISPFSRLARSSSPRSSRSRCPRSSLRSPPRGRANGEDHDALSVYVRAGAGVRVSRLLLSSLWPAVSQPMDVDFRQRPRFSALGMRCFETGSPSSALSPQGCCLLGGMSARARFGRCGSSMCCGDGSCSPSGLASTFSPAFAIRPGEAPSAAPH